MTLLADRPGTYLPTPDQHQLLRAALLLDRDAAMESLARWRSAVDLDAIDAGSMRVLPLRFRNLQRLEIVPPDAERLKGIYRRSWYRNELLLEGGRQALHELHAAGIATLLLKGAAVVTTLTSEHGIRPMQDFDLLVRRADFARAAAVLSAAGWKMDDAVRDARAHFAYQHAISFRRESADVDLHWTSIWGVFDREGEREFQAAARPAVFRGEQTRVLAPEDAVLQICAHATLAHPEVSPIRWVGDAVLTIRAAGEHFDWRRLVALAKLRRLSLALLCCLEYLRDGIDVAIPAEVLSELAAAVTAGEAGWLRSRSSLDLRFRSHTLRIWRDLAMLDGWIALPSRAVLLARFVWSRLAQRVSS